MPDGAPPFGILRILLSVVPMRDMTMTRPARCAIMGAGLKRAGCRLARTFPGQKSWE